MTAEEAAMIMMSGGSTYTNENKTITENGEYVPDEGVRWDKVTVDVPQSGGVIEKIIALPTRQGGAWGSGQDGYHYMLHYGDIESRETVFVRKYNTSASGNGEIAYTIEGKVKPAYFWFVLYKNKDNSVVFATATENFVNTNPSGNFTLGEYYDYLTRANGDTIEWWLYRHTKRNIGIVEPITIVPGSSHTEFNIKFKVHYTDVDTYYNWETGNVDKQESRTGEFTTPNSEFWIPSVIPSAAFFTNLSAAAYEQEMLNLVKILDQTIT